MGFNRMNKNYLIAVLGLFLITSSSAEARVVPLNLPMPSNPGPAALKVALGHAADLGAAGASLRVRAVVDVPDGKVVHMNQVAHGLPVVDGTAAALVLAGRLVALNGQLRVIPAGFALDRAALLKLDGVRAALRDTMPGSTARGGHLALLPPLLPTSPDGARAVWVLDVITHEPLGLFQVIADARSGAVLRKTSAMHDVQGQVYSTNPTAGKLIKATLQGLADKKDKLAGEYAVVSSCSYTSQKLDCKNHAKPDTNGDFIYKADEGKFDDPFAEVNAYYHVDIFHRWMNKTFGFKRQGKTGIDVIVNLHGVQNGQKKGMSNAFFGDLNGDGTGDLVFGQGSKDFAYDGDVVYHEFTHSAVRETSNLSIAIDSLGFNATPAALNEGFADIFSSFLAGDPVVGDYMKSTGIRNLSGNATCPGYLSGESHHDGLIWGRAVWAFRSALTGTDIDTFEAAVYTVMAGLAKNAGFTDAAKLLSTTLKAKDPTMASKMDVELKKRGVDTCTRIVPLQPAQARSFYIYGRSISPTLKAVPGPFQYKIEVPKTAESLTIYVQKTHGWGGGMGAYVRLNKEVGYDYVGPQYDHVKDTTAGSIVLSINDKTGKAKLVPGGTYYVLPLNTGNYTTVGGISVTIKDKPLVQPDLNVPAADAGAPPATDGAGVPSTDSIVLPNPVDPGSETPGRGCSCEVSDTTDGAGLALMLLLGLLVIRRRR